jgi:hypothetical protein
MNQFVLTLAAALALIIAGGSAWKQASHHPVIVAPADATLPEP